MGKEIYDEAYSHFELEGRRYEYGRPDELLKNHSPDKHTDRSRTEQDLDHDGLLGVDCSSLVWRGLKNAGYDVGNSPFTTAQLFNGHTLTPYSKEHFDVVPGTDASRSNGPLQPGDILLFKEKSSTDKHVGIFKGYDAQGHIEFFGSQVSTGPATVASKTGPGEYWNGGKFEIVDALRAKPEFRVHSPLHGQASASVAREPVAQIQTDDALQQGAHGLVVHDLQVNLAKLGYQDGHGHPLKADGDFGIDTRHAVERFQHDHHLKIDGVAGTRTLEALHEAQAKHVAPSLADTKNPDHALYEQARAAVQRLDADMGRTSDKQSDQLAASLVVAAKREHMTAIESVAISQDGSRAFAVQGPPDSPLRQIAHVPTAEAVNTPIDKSSAAAQLVNQQQVQQTTQPQSQESSAPAMGR